MELFCCQNEVSILAWSDGINGNNVGDPTQKKEKILWIMCNECVNE